MLLPQATPILLEVVLGFSSTTGKGFGNGRLPARKYTREEMEEKKTQNLVLIYHKQNTTDR